MSASWGVCFYWYIMQLLLKFSFTNLMYIPHEIRVITKLPIYENDSCWLSPLRTHTSLRSTNFNWLDNNNVSVWGDMSTRGQLFLSTHNVKYNLASLCSTKWTSSSSYGDVSCYRNDIHVPIDGNKYSCGVRQDSLIHS